MVPSLPLTPFHPGLIGPGFLLAVAELLGWPLLLYSGAIALRLCRDWRRRQSIQFVDRDGPKPGRRLRPVATGHPGGLVRPKRNTRRLSGRLRPAGHRVSK
jgi:hypothetical protein